jgi:hypothetical protein
MRTVAAIMVTTSLALLAAACGGSSGSDIARLGSTAAQSSPSSAGSGGSSDAGRSTHADALRYSQCMRSQGIIDFPDPSANGTFAIPGAGPNRDLNRDNPSFQVAERACQRYSPQQNMSPAQHAQLAREYLRFASCARSHGLSDFPDPITGSGGHPGFHFSGGSGSDLNANNPAFQRGVETCQRILGHQFRFAFRRGGEGKGA